MNVIEASTLLNNPAGHLIAHKKVKAYEVWVWEGGVTKVMGRRRMGWHPDYAKEERGAAKRRVAPFYFALANSLPLVTDSWNPETWGRFRCAEAIRDQERNEERRLSQAIRRRAAFHIVATA